MSSASEMSRSQVAQLVDHTLLKPESTAADVGNLVAEAARLGVYSVCVSPSLLPVSAPAGLKVACVVGFPSGAHPAVVKAFEASRAAEAGADEIDMVINLGLAKEGRWDLVEEEIRAVREAAPAVLLKVIIESAVLTDDEIIAACRAAEGAAADYVKTSTGFHPAGGASAHAVALMRECVGDRLGVKASGGIRVPEAAAEMIDAGASRLGLSSSAAILEGFAE